MGIIEGRREDTLLLPAVATGDEVRVHPNVFHDVFDDIDIDEWQVAQQGGALEIRLVGDPDRVSKKEVVARVSRGLASVGARPNGIVVKFVTSIVRTSIGKTPLIVHESKQVR